MPNVMSPPRPQGRDHYDLWKAVRGLGQGNPGLDAKIGDMLRDEFVTQGDNLPKDLANAIRESLARLDGHFGYGLKSF